MNTTQLRLLETTAEDVMKSPVRAVPTRTPIREAAGILFREQIGGVPVVDRDGHCVGVFSGSDVVRWLAKSQRRDTAEPPVRTCPYQQHGAPLGLEDETLCILELGACPLQVIRPLTGGRHAAVCLAPQEVLCDWQQDVEGPANVVADFMTADVVSVAPTAPLADVARMMVDAHIHRVVVLDEDGKPVGIVSATDVLAALAWHGLCELEIPVGVDAT